MFNGCRIEMFNGCRIDSSPKFLMAKKDVFWDFLANAIVIDWHCDDLYL